MGLIRTRALRLRLCLAFATIIALNSSAGAGELIPLISVQGVGISSATPDMAEVSAGALTRSSTARGALADNNAAVAGILSLVADFGIAKRDVRTAGFSLSPVFERRQRSGSDSSKPPAIVGYQASNSISIKILNINILG